jgi:aldehyde dehydrogenase (NAD+)
MDFLKKLGIQDKNFGSSTGLEWGKTTNQGELNVSSPVDGKQIASVYLASESDYNEIIALQYQTGTGKFNAERTPTIPSG